MLTSSTSPAVLRRWIGLELRRLRTEAGRSRPDAAARLRQSKTAIGHLETARNLPSAAVLEVLLGFYGAPERLEFFLDLIDAARRGRNWWEQLGGVAPPWFDLFLGLEAGAAEIDFFESYLVPGLLQTAEYSEAVMRADPEVTEDTIRQRIALRLGRQQVLNREEEPLRLWVVLDESVLYRRRGTPEVMIAQIEYLLEVADRPRVDLQVLPLTGGAHVAQQGTFNLMKFPPEMVGDPGIVYLEGLTEGRYLEAPAAIVAYERAFARLRVQAAAMEDSKELLRRAARRQLVEPLPDGTAPGS
jgi:transcriptional regulator with XRE-family HTH domain